MARMKKEELEKLANPSEAREHLMATRLLDRAKDFYRDPKNVAAYGEWKAKQKEST